jgi:hypothetical protein
VKDIWDDLALTQFKTELVLAIMGAVFSLESFF